MKWRVDLFKGGMLLTYPGYDKDLNDKAEKIPGNRFVGPAKGGPGWKFNLDMQTCRIIRERLGEDVIFTDDVLAWGRAEREKELYLSGVADHGNEEIEFPLLSASAPEWYAKFRPYQKVGSQFVMECPNPLIADDMGVGKTWEVIGGLVELGFDEGYNLVICPKTSIESVWLMELSRFVQQPVFVAPEGKRERVRLLKEVELAREEEIPFWLIVNPAMVSLRRTKRETDQYDHISESYYQVQFPFMFEIEWTCVILDEAHDSGIANPSSQLSRALHQMYVKEKKIAMTGTPMGGKPDRLFGILHWLEPKVFTSRHQWSKRWLKEMRYQPQEHMTLYESSIQKDRERKFYEEHRHYILRRTKEDVMPELPPLQKVDIWVDMTPKQRKQYMLMEEEAMAHIMEGEDRVGRVNVPNMLATNTWLKQFANGYCDLVEKGQVYNEELDEFIMKYRAMPTLESPKFEAVEQILSSVGIKDPDKDEQVIIFTQFRTMADVLTEHLRQKYKVAKITGDITKRGVRNQIQSDFQAGGVYEIIVMTTKTGGVSINLDAANTVIFIDETWTPDDQEQAAGRALRASRIHRVTAYTILTKQTIEEDVRAKLKKKQNVNDILLDRYRRYKEEHAA